MALYSIHICTKVKQGHESLRVNSRLQEEGMKNLITRFLNQVMLIEVLQQAGPASCRPSPPHPWPAKGFLPLKRGKCDRCREELQNSRPPRRVIAKRLYHLLPCSWRWYSLRLPEVSSLLRARPAYHRGEQLTPEDPLNTTGIPDKNPRSTIFRSSLSPPTKDRSFQLPAQRIFYTTRERTAMAQGSTTHEVWR